MRDNKNVRLRSRSHVVEEFSILVLEHRHLLVNKEIIFLQQCRNLQKLTIQSRKNLCTNGEETLSVQLLLCTFSFVSASCDFFFHFWQQAKAKKKERRSAWQNARNSNFKHTHTHARPRALFLVLLYFYNNRLLSTIFLLVAFTCA